MAPLLGVERRQPLDHELTGALEFLWQYGHVVTLLEAVFGEEEVDVRLDADVLECLLCALLGAAVEHDQPIAIASGHDKAAEVRTDPRQAGHLPQPFSRHPEGEVVGELSDV